VLQLLAELQSVTSPAAPLDGTGRRYSAVEIDLFVIAVSRRDALLSTIPTLRRGRTPGLRAPHPCSSPDYEHDSIRFRARARAARGFPRHPIQPCTSRPRRSPPSVRTTITSRGRARQCSAAPGHRAPEPRRHRRRRLGRTWVRRLHADRVVAVMPSEGSTSGTGQVAVIRTARRPGARHPQGSAARSTAPAATAPGRPPAARPIAHAVPGCPGRGSSAPGRRIPLVGLSAAIVARMIGLPTPGPPRSAGHRVTT